MYFYNMKKYILFLLIGFVFNLYNAIAQPSSDTTAPYFKQKGIPKISVLLYDSSTVITKSSIANKHLIALTYFSPTCDHCKEHAKQLLDKIDSTPNIFYIWVGPSHSSLAEIKEFAINFQLTNKPNLIVGKETEYFLPTFFRMETTPYCVVYKNEELFVEFRHGSEMKDFISINNNQYSPKAVMETIKTSPQNLPSSKKEKKKFKKPE